MEDTAGAEVGTLVLVSLSSLRDGVLVLVLRPEVRIVIMQI